jgi:hypothetical protein
MYTDLLADGRLYALLQRCDEDLAAGQRAQGCPRCGGALHAAHYPRKPRGGPAGLGPEYGRRLSYCCAREGCRKRATPPSLRFLGRKVYLAAVVVLISAMRSGPTPARMQFLQDRVGVSRRTILRWCRWWSQVFTATPFWRAAAGGLMPPVRAAQLPASLLERFAGAALDRLCALLRFVAPITTGNAAVHAA